MENLMFREATTEDIPQMHAVRISVKENALSDPSLIKEKDYEEYIINRGKGWVCEKQNVIVGFAIVSLADNNVWALFVHPQWERKGLARALHKIMLDWYFSKTSKTLWLSTSPNTRAEMFYRTAGWNQNGLQKNGELRFEIGVDDWMK